MDKKYIERPAKAKFNKSAYNKQYDKDNYKKFSTVIKPDLFIQIDDFCKNHNISKADFLKLAITTLESLER